MVTALAAVVVMTRSRLTATAKQAGVSETPPELMGAPTAVGVGALDLGRLAVRAARTVGLVGPGPVAGRGRRPGAAVAGQAGGH